MKRSSRRPLRRGPSDARRLVSRSAAIEGQLSFRSITVSIVLTSLVATGCATIPENVSLVIESTPTGMTVVSSEGWQCSTPCTRDVLRDSQFDLEVEQPGYRTVKQAVEIPELNPSRIGTFIGTGVGVVAGIGAIELGEAIGTVLFDVLFAELLGPFELSTREKLQVVVQGAFVFGGVGYVIDRLRDRERAKQPYRIDLTMFQHNVDNNQRESDPATSKDVTTD